MSSCIVINFIFMKEVFQVSVYGSAVEENRLARGTVLAYSEQGSYACERKILYDLKAIDAEPQGDQPDGYSCDFDG